MRKQSTRAPGAQAPKKTSTPKRAASPATRTRRPPATPKTAGRAGGKKAAKTFGQASKPPGPHASGCQSSRPVKVQLGCGENLLDGWQNFGREPGIERALPFETSSVDFLYLEHVIEHVDYLTSMRFFAEAKRVLRPGGVLRLVFPDVLRAPKKKWHAIMLGHGHRMVWSSNMLHLALLVSGFSSAVGCPYRCSAHVELCGLEIMSGQRCDESSIIEATK